MSEDSHECRKEKAKWQLTEKELDYVVAIARVKRAAGALSNLEEDLLAIIGKRVQEIPGKLEYWVACHTEQWAHKVSECPLCGFELELGKGEE